MSDDARPADADAAVRDGYARLRRQDQLVGQRHSLAGLLEAVGDRVVHYEKHFAVDRRDVERMERSRFVRLVSDLLLGKDVRLGELRLEAEAAWQKLEGERARQVQLEVQLNLVTTELAALGDARDRYDLAVRRKSRSLTDGGDARGEELAALHERFMAADADLREHTEAHQASLDARGRIVRIYEHLEYASAHSRIDMFGSAVAPYADYYEHKHLTAAHDLVWDAQDALDRLTRELADVGVQASAQVPVVGTRWFADMFVDNLAVDWRRHREIRETFEHVRGITHWVVSTEQWLRERCGELGALRDELAGHRDRLLFD